jgi:branched-chain amino acid transport system permease protein
MEFFLVSMLNGLSYGLLLFMLSSGLTLIFSMMGVLNFAHASFYMLGATSPTRSRSGRLLAGARARAAARRAARRAVRARRACAACTVRPCPELLITFGLSFVIIELVQLVWGRDRARLPAAAGAAGPGVHARQLVGRRAAGRRRRRIGGAVRRGRRCSPFPATRGFMMAVALLMLLALWLLLTTHPHRLVIQSALTHPEMVEALGHNVPRVFMARLRRRRGAGGAGRRDRRQHLRHRAGDGRDGGLR